MLYKDFGIVLYGLHIRITPMLASDAESYARLMFGDMYDSFTQRLGKPHPLIEFLEYDHPGMYQRIKAIREAANGRKA